MNKKEIKELAKENGMRFSNSCYDVIDIKIKELILQAIERATNSKRKTVKPIDF